MKRMIAPPVLACAIAGLALLVGRASAVPLGTGVSYQGRLKSAGQPANGTFNLVFTLWDAPGAGNPPVGGVQIGGPDNEPTTTVTDGLFTVQLNDSGQFGAAAFNGQARWVQVSVNGTVLGPRQPLTASPYALYALGGPGGSGPWAVNGTSIYNTNAGAVGVGTNSPVADLHVNGLSSTLPGLHVQAPGNATGDIIFGSPTGIPGMTVFANNGFRRDIRFHDSGIGLYSHGATGIPPTGSGMFIGDNARVGIGNTAPTGKLEVTGGVGEFGLRVTSPDIAVYATHSGSGSAPGVYGVTNSTSAGAHAVRGLVSGSTPASDAAGVHGECSSTTAGLGVSGEGYWGVYGISKNTAGYGGVFACSDGLFGTGRALLVGGDAEISDSLLVGNAFISAQAKLHVVNGTDSAPGGGGFIVTGDTAGANLSMDNNEIMARSAGQPATLYLNNEGGDVRIGQNGIAPCTLYVPVVAITGADVAEKFPVSGDRADAAPGTVMEIDPDNAGKLRVARGAYNRRVAGVVSGAGDLPAGAILGNLPGHEDAPAIALSGRVWVRCDADRSAIQIGDLLTTSDVAGHAMKAVDRERSHGAVIGKAMTALDVGKTGLVLVLVNLQ